VEAIAPQKWIGDAQNFGRAGVEMTDFFAADFFAVSNMEQIAVPFDC
jgi:hypothetical protein